MLRSRPIGVAVSDVAAIRRATTEYADILITLTLCVKIAGPTKSNVRACAERLRVRVRETHSVYRLNQIIQANDPFAEFQAMRREVNAINARHGIAADTFI